MAKLTRMSTPAKEVMPTRDGRGDAGQVVAADSTATSSRSVPTLRLAGAVPDPDVPEKAARRRFTAEYKLRSLRDADGA